MGHLRLPLEREEIVEKIGPQNSILQIQRDVNPVVAFNSPRRIMNLLSIVE
jgi:hypothetical protein